MAKRRRTLLTVVLALVGFVAVAIVWSRVPLHSGVGEPDPAVIFENQRSTNGQIFTESYFQHAGLNLHYVETGKPDAETILFVHGFPSYWYSFIRQIESLRAEYRIIAIDGLGAGRSDAPRDVAPYKLEHMTAHVKALLDHLNVSEVHMVGHDWGAAFAFAYAQKYPGQTKSVTGVSAPPQNIMLELLATNTEQRASSTYIERLKSANPILLTVFRASTRIWENAYLPLVKAGKLSPEEGDLFRQATGNAKRINTHINWYRANIPGIDEIRDDDFWPSRQSKLDVPATIVWGNDDRAFVEEFIELLDESSEELRVIKLDGVGHWPHVEESQIVTEAIRAMIRGNAGVSDQNR